MIRPAAEKFTQQNIEFIQAFLDYMSTVDPRELKFFDESGLKLPDVANPNYGHSRIGTHCVKYSETCRRQISRSICCVKQTELCTLTQYFSQTQSRKRPKKSNKMDSTTMQGTVGVQGSTSCIRSSTTLL